ncbi:hypothetical protein IWQ60_012082, partial [Tieghemiomyces parasiticus]
MLFRMTQKAFQAPALTRSLASAALNEPAHLTFKTGQTFSGKSFGAATPAMGETV